MKICVLYPSVCAESAKYLADRLGAKAINFYENGFTNLLEFDYVFNYGVGDWFNSKNVINKPFSVGMCVDKRDSFSTFKAAKIPTVAHVTRKRDIPKSWEWIVVRKSATSSRAQDVDYVQKGDRIPDGELYTEWFNHKYEYRIVVFNNQIVGRYYKRYEDDLWHFVLQPKKGFEEMDRACLKAAKALQIDYVGFDVLAKNKKKFAIIEANSGAMITEESVQAIAKFFKKL